jgi:ketosteroid isomerase-like protein
VSIPNATSMTMPAALFSNVGVVSLVAALGVLLSTSASAATGSAKEQVWAAELAFARTMQERDLKAFGEFVSEEAIFFNGTTALHGKSKVVEAWTKFFAAPEAPFSWEPDQVEVLESGTLALSTGPVRDRTGKITGRFNSIWRLEAPNRWRVVFDKGSPPSPGPN